MSDTAFHEEEEQAGGSSAFIPSAPTEEAMGPPTGLNDEQAAAQESKFNRSKMGGFLMELGLNILSSNRDDAGAAVGDAFGKTRADRDTRKKTQAAESLAQSERERETRRQDEADENKRAKEARAVRRAEIAEAEEGRKVSKAERDRVEKSQKDEDKLTTGQEAIKGRAAEQRLDDMINAISDTPTKEDEKKLGFDPTRDEVIDYALTRISARDRKLLEQKSGTENYKDRNWNE